MPDDNDGEENMWDDGEEEYKTPSALYRRDGTYIQPLQVDCGYGVLPERYLLNVRSLQSDFDCSGGHYNLLASVQLISNMLRPGDPTCWSPSGYQGVMLTYTRTD
jgi:lipopolysaccharide biosynthesis protein